jgi:hypothetical protein
MFEILAKQIGAILVRAIQRQFILQGHRLTGKLNSSIEDIVKLTVTGATIQIVMEEYGIIQNNGVSASRIPYDPTRRTGAGRSQYIEGLRKFAVLRFGLSGKEALGAAFAIARKQAQQGMPTKGSFRFSKTGRRTGAIEAALEDVDMEITRLSEQFLEDIIIENLAA